MMKPSNPLSRGLFGVLFGCLFAAGALQGAAPQVLVVDNNGGPHADFTDLQEAIDAADEGAIIHVLGSGVSYGPIEINRRMHLIGPGFNVVRVLDEGYQNRNDAMLGDVEFNPTGTSTPSGSSLTGFRLSGSIFVRSSDITLQRNYAFQILLQSVTVDDVLLEEPHRATILQNALRSVLGLDISAASGHTVVGNITNLDQAGTTRTVRNATVRNNVFGDRGSTAATTYTFHGSVVENNLMTSIGSSSRNNTLRNNMIRSSSPTTSAFLDENNFAGNTWNLGTGGWDALFTRNGDFGEQYQLSEESAARGAGLAGLDIGAYAGEHPFVISGIPGIPRVTIMAPGPFLVSPHSDLTIPVRIQAQ